MKKSVIQSLLIILTFCVAFFGRTILGSFIDIQISEEINKIIYGYSWWMLPILITTGYLYGFKKIVKEFCLHKGFITGFLFGLAVTLPMLVGYSIIGEVDSELTTTRLIHKSVFAGFMEEVLFRGFLFGLLFRNLKWGFVPAALLGAVLFGLGHIAQGNNLLQTFGVFMVTFMGAVWFAWLFIEWKENLWVAIWIHTLMNFSWVFFTVSDSGALGGYSANIFRITTIVLSIVGTVWYNKKKDKFRIKKGNLLFNK